MKRRSPMPPRRTRLTRTTGLARELWPVTAEQVGAYNAKQWKRRHDAALAARSAPRRQRDTGPTSKTRDLIREERAQFRCEVSGRYLGKNEGHIHHRRPRRAGGDRRPDVNAPQNLLLVSPEVHAWIEDKGRAEAQELGLLLHDRQDPLTTSVQLRHGRVLLDAVGSWRLDDTTNHPTGEAA